ncbi:hypothetical protein AAVH_12888 [Aphelenchoides avenae]|nr:hypothetical protein AAVH_12888 [Aphelenchus avenae]
MSLRELVEEEFGAHLKWMADAEFNAIVRRSSIDTQTPVDPPAKDANANIVPPRTLQVVESHHAPADANKGYATPAWKDKRRLQELLSYLQESEALVADDQLVATRTAKTVKFNGDRHPMPMNFVDYFALIKYGGHLSLDDYDGLREWVDFDDFSDQNFGRELRDVRLRIVGDRQTDAFYGFHHPVIRWNDTTHISLREGDSAFPHMPKIAVFKRGQSAEGSSKTRPLTFVTMERLEIFDDKQLIFTCIRLARSKKLPPQKEQAMKTECLIEI